MPIRLCNEKENCFGQIDIVKKVFLRKIVKRSIEDKNLFERFS